MPSLSWSDALRYLLVGFVAFLFYAILDVNAAKGTVEKVGEIPLTGVLLAGGALLYFAYRGLVFPVILRLKDLLGTSEKNYRLWLKETFPRYRLSTGDAEFIHARLRSKKPRDTDSGLQVTASGIHLMYMSSMLAAAFALCSSVSNGSNARIAFWATAIVMALLGFLSDRNLEWFEASLLKETPADDIKGLVEGEFGHRCQDLPD